jgi:hypothetical protein
MFYLNILNYLIVITYLEKFWKPHLDDLLNTLNLSLIYQTDDMKLDNFTNILVLIKGWLWYSSYLIKSNQRDQLVEFLDRLKCFSSTVSKDLDVVLSLVKNSIIVI